MGSGLRVFHGRRSVACAGIEIGRGGILLDQHGALVEHLHQLVRRGVYRFLGGVAEVDHQRVLLVHLAFVDPAALGLLDGVAAEVLDQDGLRLLHRFRLGEHGLAAVLVVGAQIHHVLHVRLGCGRRLVDGHDVLGQVV